MRSARSRSDSCPAHRPFATGREPFARSGCGAELAANGTDYKNTKYLTKVVFMPHRNGGYWSDKGYEWYGGT